MVVILGRYVTVSVKVPLEVKEKMKLLNIKPSTLFRRAIEEEVRRREIQRIKDEIESLKPMLNRIRTEAIVRSIREDRDQR